MTDHTKRMKLVSDKPDEIKEFLQKEVLPGVTEQIVKDAFKELLKFSVELNKEAAPSGRYMIDRSDSFIEMENKIIHTLKDKYARQKKESAEIKSREEDTDSTKRAA